MTDETETRPGTFGRLAEIERQLTDLFLSDGFASLSMDAISSALSCSKASLYALGSSRGDVIARIANGYFRDPGGARRKQLAGQRVHRLRRMTIWRRSQGI